MSEAIPKRSVIVAGHRTSVSLEEPFWSRLKEIARQRNMSINDLVTEIDASETATGRQGNLSSALRLHVLAELERRLTGGLAGGPPPTPLGTGIAREPGA
jgi:predicted DNA-binding ribbon-helix-helix protein